MKSRKPNEKCLSHLKWNMYTFNKSESNHGDYFYESEYKYTLVWYRTKTDRWNCCPPNLIEIKLNELQRTK